MWDLRIGMIGEPESPEFADDKGQRAFRARHVETRLVLPIAFGCKQDAVRAVNLLNEELPCTDMDAEQVRTAILETYGSKAAFRQHVIANCCQW